MARAQYEHAIAVLVGKVASDFSIPVRPELTAPPPIPMGMPSELLQRRPDIAAAERTLAEANATIGIGYGAFYPSVTLSAAGGIESSTFKNWFSWPSRFWSIGPSISQTIFNGGLYRAELNQYTATYNADVAAYRQTVLIAFQQVEDYLAAVRLYSQQVERQQAAVAHAQEFLNLEMGRYQTGIDPYVDVVTAQTTLLTDQQVLATSSSGANDFGGRSHRGAGWRMGRLAVTHSVSAHEESWRLFPPEVSVRWKVVNSIQGVGRCAAERKGFLCESSASSAVKALSQRMARTPSSKRLPA